MGKKKGTVKEQIKKALDGRTQRWLAIEIKMAESELSKRLRDPKFFDDSELASIEKRLNCTITR